MEFGKKGQGSLEYLIIIAAVLAIAAIVVLFLTGAFSGTDTDSSECKTAAAKCAVDQVTSPGATCGFCEAACSGLSVFANDSCKAGQPENISSDTVVVGYVPASIGFWPPYSVLNVNYAASTQGLELRGYDEIFDGSEATKPDSVTYEGTTYPIQLVSAKQIDGYLVGVDYVFNIPTPNLDTVYPLYLVDDGQAYLTDFKVSKLDAIAIAGDVNTIDAPSLCIGCGGGCSNCWPKHTLDNPGLFTEQ